jgi:hypothetical protein
MLNSALALLLATAIGVGAGLRPAIDVGGSRVWMGVYGGGGGNLGGGTSSFFRLGVRTIVPMCNRVGIYAHLADLSLMGVGGNTIEVCNRFGFIEMIPIRHVSPYFKQSFVFRHGFYFEELAFALGLGAGIEFLSDSRLSPFLEGEAFSFLRKYDDWGLVGLDLSCCLGVRLKLGKGSQ